MDSVVALAGRISSEIIKSYEESLIRTSNPAPVTELNAQDEMSKETLEGVLS